jgi:hypothetical protein
MMKKKSMIAVILIISLLVGGLAINALAAAGSPSDSPAGLLRQGIMAGQQRAQTALNVVAELTGLSTEDVRAERLEGKSLADIAEAEGINEQTVIDKVIAERTAALDQLKADQKITDEQYENCLTNMQERVKTNIERTTVGPAQGNKIGQGMGCCQGACSGQGPGQGQGRGMGRGMNGNQANCPYNTNL